MKFENNNVYNSIKNKVFKDIFKCAIFDMEYYKTMQNEVKDSNKLRDKLV